MRVGQAARNVVPLFLGALTAKIAVNKFTEGGSETQRWTWSNVGVAVLSGFVVALGASAVFGAKYKVAQRILEGAMLITAYKAFTTQLAPKWGWTETWFGADDDEIHPDLLGESGYPKSGSMYQGEDNTYVYGADGQLRPIDDSHRDPQVMGFDADLVSPSQSLSADLVDPSQSLSGVLVDPNPSFADDPAVSTIQAFRRSYNIQTA